MSCATGSPRGAGTGMPVPAGLSRGSWTAILVAVATWTMVLAWLLRFPCHQAGWGAPGAFQMLCYSDLGTLYGSAGMAQGHFAYFSQDPSALLEYPVLQSLIASLTGQVSHRLSSGMSEHAAQSMYVDVNFVLLLLVWIAVVLLAARMVRRPAHALALAMAPAVAATGLINWDLWPVLCSVAALLLMRRRAWLLGGALLGLGAALKLWPFVMLGAVAVLAIRRRSARPALLAFAGGIGAWLVVNVPMALIDPRQWRFFWEFSGERGAGFSSVYDVWNRVVAVPQGLERLSADTINLVAYGVFALCCLAILALGLLARREPTLEELSLLIVAAFVLTNKVYSPQFVLWLVPLVILARPRLREFAAWQAVEVAHWAVVFTWLHAMTTRSPRTETLTDLYAAVVVLHVLAVLWLCGRVVVRLLRDAPGGAADSGPEGPGPAILSADRSVRSAPVQSSSTAGDAHTGAEGAGRHG